MSPNPAVLTWPRAVVSGWTPASLTGLAAWFDASDTSTITHVGGAVSQWADKSGNANHLAQSNASYKPTTGSVTINSLNALQFSVDFLDSNAAAESEFTRAYVVKSTQGASNVGILSDGSNGGIQVHSITDATPKIGFRLGLAGRPFPSETAKSYDVNTSYLLTVTYKPTVSSSIRVNGSQASAGSGDFVAAGTLRVGAYRDNYNAHWTGNIGEIVQTSTVLTGSDLSNLESYLMAKWGIS